MGFHKRAIARALGLVLAIIGLSMIPALVVTILYHEYGNVRAFLIPICLLILTGVISLIRYRNDSAPTLRIRDGYLIASLSWILASIAGSLPYILSGSISEFYNAFFESASGFTTTGATILTDVEKLDKGILFWRSFTQWIGGMGIIVLAVALLPALGIGGQTIAKAETPGPTLDKLTPRISDTARRLYLLYCFFTLSEIVFLSIGGLSPYDAVTTSLSSISTGGFSPYADSISHFGSAYVEGIVIVFMIMGGINFNLYYTAAINGPKQFLRDTEFKGFSLILIFAAFVICVDVWLQGAHSLAASLRQSIFQTASIMTSTGFMTADYNMWPSLSKLVLLLLMAIGGCSSSTSGGLKVIRTIIAAKLIRRGFTVRLHPRAVVAIKINNTSLQSDKVTAIANFVFLYIFTLIAGNMIIAFDGYDLVTNFSATVSSLSNIGPGMNLAGPTSNLNFFSPLSKFTLSFLMLAGRLELFSIFMLFSPQFWNSDRPNR